MYYHLFYRVFLSISIALFGWGAHATSPESAIEATYIDLYNQTDKRPVKVNLWFKKGDCDKPSSNTYCLDNDSQKQRLAILSHGAMGAASDYNWLAYTLASQGWVVVGLNHFGESYRYGRENVDPKTSLKLWQRAQDTSFVLDALAKTTPFQGKVDWQSAVFIGHSSGGQTAASLAGVTLNMSQMTSYCQSEKSKGDMGCSYASSKQADQIGAIPAYKQSFRDERIKAVVMLDPAIGPAATTASLQSVDIPALIIGAKNNDFLPFDHHAGYYAKHIPNATLVTLDNNEGHFVFLNSCQHKFKALGVSLCEDREGVNRNQVHQQLRGDILGFLQQQLFIN